MPSQTCSTALSITAHNRSRGPQLGAGTGRQTSVQTVHRRTLPEFTHSTSAAFHVAGECNLKSHVFQELLNFLEPSSFVALPRRESEQEIPPLREGPTQ